mmetsp:Transcript_146251/g.407402  ORF Transcript_146251/g.407402 Transcript_146251/m.407402 type:complete len:183 (-) Transcript_146251:113-661(-)
MARTHGVIFLLMVPVAGAIAQEVCANGDTGCAAQEAEQDSIGLLQQHHGNSKLEGSLGLSRNHANSTVKDDCDWVGGCANKPGGGTCSDCKYDGSDGFKACCPEPGQDASCDWVRGCKGDGTTDGVCADCQYQYNDGFLKCCGGADYADDPCAWVKICKPDFQGTCGDCYNDSSAGFLECCP